METWITPVTRRWQDDHGLGSGRIIHHPMEVLQPLSPWSRMVCCSPASCREDGDRFMTDPSHVNTAPTWQHPTLVLRFFHSNLFIYIFIFVAVFFCSFRMSVQVSFVHNLISLFILFLFTLIYLFHSFKYLFLSFIQIFISFIRFFSCFLFISFFLPKSPVQKNPQCRVIAAQVPN